jgi:hypothetical protein
MDFEPIRLDTGEGRCAQVRDLIPPGSLTPGWFRYEVRVLTRGSELVTVEREFSAVEHGQPRSSRFGTSHEPRDVAARQSK